MNNISLPDVELCMIVKDELANPAGGIEDFVHSTLPFVAKGTIVDTGSQDGTKERLDTLTLQYPHLVIHTYLPERPFDFATARNYSLSLTSHSWILIVDGDERLTPEDFKNLKTLLQNRPPKYGWNFVFRNIYTSSDDVVGTFGHLNPRLFRMQKGLFFDGICTRGGELLRLNGTNLRKWGEDIEIEIKHFKAEKDLSERSRTYNPKRDSYR